VLLHFVFNFLDYSAALHDLTNTQYEHKYVLNVITFAIVSFMRLKNNSLQRYVINFNSGS